MTKDRLEELRKNCASCNPDVRMMKELFEYLLDEKVSDQEERLRTFQRVFLKYIDEKLNTHW